MPSAEHNDNTYIYDYDEADPQSQRTIESTYYPLVLANSTANRLLVSTKVVVFVDERDHSFWARDGACESSPEDHVRLTPALPPQVTLEEIIHSIITLNGKRTSEGDLISVHLGNGDAND